MNLFINTYSIITPKLALGNGFRHEAGSMDFNSFMRHLYTATSLDYPKFFKMDNLSKLGFITSELMLKNFDLNNYHKDEVGIVISNSNSSTDTDKTYYDTIRDKQEYFPSPALFVYTLPNIMIGEICIKHKISGENGLFISETFDYEFITSYVSNLFASELVNCCMVGWVDFSEKKYQSILCMVTAEHNNDSILFTAEKVKKLYSLVSKNE